MKKGIVYTIGSAVLFGLNPLFTKYVYLQGATAMTVVFFRSFIVAWILLVLLWLKHESFALERYEIKQIFIISWFGTGLTTILLNQSFALMDTGTATNLHFLYPVFVVVICRIRYQEQLSKQKKIALSIAVFAIFIFLLEGNGGSLMGYLFAIASSITYAFYLVKMEKSGLVRMNALKLSFYVAVFVSLEGGVLHLFQDCIVFDLPRKAYVLLFIIAIATSFLGAIWMQKGISYLGSAMASVFCLFEPVTSLICGALFLQEELTVVKMVGCSLILCSLILFVRKKKCANR